jgi:hypothetical protein
VIARLKGGVSLDRARKFHDERKRWWNRRAQPFSLVAQVTAALIFLTGAGLLIRSFYEIAQVDAGFRPDHLMTTRLAPAPFKFRGRALLESDSPTSPLVAVINQTLANQFLPGEDPVGKRLEIAFFTPLGWREIVGVVADAKAAGLDQSTPVQVYADYLQEPAFPRSSFRDHGTARTAQGPRCHRLRDEGRHLRYPTARNLFSPYNR